MPSGRHSAKSGRRNALEQASSARTVETTRVPRGRDSSSIALSETDDHPRSNIPHGSKPAEIAEDDRATSGPGVDPIPSHAGGSVEQYTPTRAVALRPLNKDQRIKFFEFDPLVDRFHAQNVHCKECDVTLPLKKDRQYDLENWHSHCLRLHHRTRDQVNNMRLKVLDDEPLADPVDIVAAFLERDPLVGKFEPDSVFCTECNKWLSSGQSDSLKGWHRHCMRATHARTEAQIAMMEQEAREAVKRHISQLRDMSPRKSKGARRHVAQPDPADAASEVGSPVNGEAPTSIPDVDAPLPEVEQQEPPASLELGPSHQTSQPTTIVPDAEEHQTPPAIAEPVLRGETLVRAFFAHDPLVRDYKSKAVLCGGCKRWIQLGQAWTLPKWHAHCERPVHARPSETTRQLEREVLQKAANQEAGDEDQAEQEPAPDPEIIMDDTDGTSMPPPMESETRGPPTVRLRPPTDSELAQDERVREFDAEHVRCLGDGHWVVRADWREHVLACKPLALEIGRTFQERQRKQRRSLQALGGATDPLVEWPQEELNADPRVRSFSLDRIQCNGCGARMGRDLRQKWADHRVRCFKIQLLLQQDLLPREAEDIAPRALDGTEILADLPAEEDDPPADDVPAADDARETSSLSDDDAVSAGQPAEPGWLPVPLDFNPRVFSGASKEAMHLARALEFDIDPLVRKVTEVGVTCNQCGKMVLTKHWRVHCRVVHNRPEDEQTQFILRSRTDAIAATSKGRSRGRRRSGKRSRVAAAPISVAKRSLKAQLAEDMDEVTGDDFGAPMQVNRDDGNDAENGDVSFLHGGSGGSGRRRSSGLTSFHLDDTALHKRFIRSDPLAHSVDVVAEKIVCGKCDEKKGLVSIAGARGAHSFQYWNRHCMSLHGRSIEQVEELMQQLFSWSEDDDSATVHHPKRRAETQGERSPAKRRRVADQTNDLDGNDGDVPSGAIRVQTESQAQCNDCGRWVNLRNFRDHYLRRCNFRTTRPDAVIQIHDDEGDDEEGDELAEQEETIVSAPHVTLAAPPLTDPISASQSHNLADYAGVSADEASKRQAAFLFFLWTHNALAKIAYLKRQRELEEAAAEAAQE